VPLKKIFASSFFKKTNTGEKVGLGKRRAVRRQGRAVGRFIPSFVRKVLVLGGTPSLHEPGALRS